MVFEGVTTMDEAMPRVPQSGLILSASEQARWDAALKLAQAAVCSAPNAPCGVCRDCRKAARGVHPDIQIVTKGTDENGKPRRELTVDTIRELVMDARVLPNEAARKVYLLRDAGEMNLAAQNALLKLLEEPPEFVCILLCAERASLLLETIRSRCRSFTINTDASDEAPEEYAEQAQRYLALCEQGDRLALMALSETLGALDHAQADLFFAAVHARLAEILCRRVDTALSAIHAAELLRLCERCMDALQFNAGIRHVFALLAVRSVPPGEQPDKRR